MVSQQRPLSHEVALHWAVRRNENLRAAPSSVGYVKKKKQPSSLTSVANDIFLVATFLIVPLASVSPTVGVDFHTELCVVAVVGLVFRPRVIAHPGAVVTNPGPYFIFVLSSNSNPVIRRPCSFGQDGHHIVVLFLVLDDHHVCVAGLAPLSGFLPVHGAVGVVVRPAQSDANHKASYRRQAQTRQPGNNIMCV